MISGTPYSIAEIDAEWHRIGPLVAGVDPRDNAGDELRRCCREGGKTLLVTSDDGFMVLSLEPDAYGTGELELFIRMAASWGERGTIQRNDAHLDAIARELGAKRIVFHTLRSGMHRVLLPEWRVRYTVFERDVRDADPGTPA
jgi:hypothetical protein